MTIYEMIFRKLLGKAVTANTYAPAYTEGDEAALAVDKTSGGVLVHQRALVPGTDIAGAVGDLAHDAAETNAQGPVKIGAIARSATNLQAGVSVGDRCNLVCDQFGRLIVLNSYKDSATVFASTPRTVAPTDFATTNYYATALKIFINVTAISATPSVTFHIDMRDPVSGGYVTVLSSAAIVATTAAPVILQVHPLMTPVTNLVAQYMVTAQIRIRAVHGDTDSITYSVGIEYA